VVVWWMCGSCVKAMGSPHESEAWHPLLTLPRVLYELNGESCLRKAAMCNNAVAARTFARSSVGVRGPKTPMDRQESGVKKRRRGYHTLVRLRAEYEIRKARRWLQKAVEFVPSKTLAWLKAVRACLNLRFRKGTLDEPPNSEEGGIVVRLHDEEVVDNGVVTIHIDPPFPFWWAWWRVKADGYLAVYLGRDTEDLLMGASSCWPLRLVEADQTIDMDDSQWTRPEALGGPHVSMDEVFLVDPEVSTEFQMSTFQLRLFGTRRARPSELRQGHLFADAGPPDYSDFLARLQAGEMSLDEIADMEGGMTMGTERSDTLSWLNW